MTSEPTNDPTGNSSPRGPDAHEAGAAQDATAAQQGQQVHDTPDRREGERRFQDYRTSEISPYQDVTPEGEPRDVPQLDETHSHVTATRRDFLAKVTLGLGAAGAVILGGPLVGFLIAPLFRDPPEVWRSLGPVSQFRVGETVQVIFEEASPLPWAGVTARISGWLSRVSEDEFIVFTVQCTHLGCPVNWLAGAKLFLCPCHGGVYYPDGQVAAGPPPAPLPRYPVRIRNGEVEINVGVEPDPQRT